MGHGDRDEAIRFYDVATLEPSGSAIRAAVTVRGLAATSTDLLLSGRDEGGVAVWRLSDAWFSEQGSFGQVVRPSDLAPQDMMFTPDGSKLVVIGPRSEVSLYDVDTGVERWHRNVCGDGKFVHAVAISADGKTVAVGGGPFVNERSGDIALLDARTGTVRPPLMVGTTLVQTLAFSADGMQLAVGTRPLLLATKGEFAIIDLESLAVKTLDSSPVADVAFVSGRFVWARYAASDAPTTRFGVFDTSSDRSHVRFVDVQGSVSAFASTGRGLEFFAGVGDRRVGVVNLGSRHSPATVRIFGSHRGYVHGVTVSDDGALAASGDLGGEIILWDVKSGDQLITPFATGGDGSLPRFRRRSRGRGLAVAGNTGVIALDGDPSSWPARACRTAHRSLSRTEWRRYIGSGRAYEATCTKH